MSETIKKVYINQMERNISAGLAGLNMMMAIEQDEEIFNKMVVMRDDLMEVFETLKEVKRNGTV